MNPSKRQIIILVTGGAGFIGSNFIPFFLNKNLSYKVINLDCLTYAGNIQYLSELENNERYVFIKGDICDKELVTGIFKKYDIDGVIHFAAESHVDNSITSPEKFIKTNVDGTFNLLEVAKNSWGENNENKRFHHISTDEVYGSLESEGLFTERTPYAPNSPYSASKAASDFLVRSYYHTYGLNAITTNCSNNFGPKQHDEKLIPTVVRKALLLEDIPIYGKGTNIRDWLFVLDHCEGINKAFHKGEAGETYLLGGNNEFTNLQIAETICGILNKLQPKDNGSYSDQITFVTDRKGHDFRYAIDASKSRIKLGWNSKESFDSALLRTVTWYLKKYNNLKK